MRTLITVLFGAVSVVVAMLLGKCIASSKDFKTRSAIIIGALLLWTACVWLLLLYWRNAFAQ
jgi:protein-S-isoprenylcysteine O-methyltransferase Ste14